jgi:hypothetical protein
MKGTSPNSPRNHLTKSRYPRAPPVGRPENLKRTALLVKGEMLAAIALACSPQANSVGCLDPRRRTGVVQSFSDPARAGATFRQAVRRSEERGWRVFYMGAPMYS